MKNVWLCLTLLAASSVHAQELPFYQAIRAAGEIRVDGKLDEFSWSSALRMGPFKNIRNLDAKQPSMTQAIIVWDDRNLYAAFISSDREPWGTMMKKDMHLWDQEVVEVFLDPDADGRDYPELEVSPLNVIVDLLIPAPGEIPADDAAKWDIEGLKTAVNKSEAGWIVEMSIPFASLKEAGVTKAPRPGDRWRVGMYRIERPGGAPRGEKLDAAKARLEKATGGEAKKIQSEIDELMKGSEFLAWSPTQRSFHEPERFGIVEFVLWP